MNSKYAKGEILCFGNAVIFNFCIINEILQCACANWIHQQKLEREKNNNEYSLPTTLNSVTPRKDVSLFFSSDDQKSVSTS